MLGIGGEEKIEKLMIVELDDVVWARARNAGGSDDRRPKKEMVTMMYTLISLTKPVTFTLNRSEALHYEALTTRILLHTLHSRMKKPA